MPLGPADAPFAGDLLVAVSGGGDSVALLHLLLDAGWPRESLAVAHVGHGVRVGADAEAERVAGIAARLNVAFHRRDLSWSEPAAVSHEELRNGRRRILRDLADEFGYTAVGLAHTADDQRETRWLALIRGAGLRGLAGMVPWSPPFWRPLLETSRADLRAWLIDRGVRWCEDPTNLDFRQIRSRLRHWILPAVARPLTERENLRVRILQDEDRYMVGRAVELAARLSTAAGLALEVRGLRSLPAAMQRRVLRHWLGGQVDAGRVEAVRGALGRPASRPRRFDLGARRTVILGHRFLVRWEVEPRPLSTAASAAFEQDWSGLGRLEVCVTAPQASEMMLVPLGRFDAPRSVLQELSRWKSWEGVPSELRSLAPVLLEEERPIWVPYPWRAGHPERFRRGPAELVWHPETTFAGGRERR